MKKLILFIYIVSSFLLLGCTGSKTASTQDQGLDVLFSTKNGTNTEFGFTVQMFGDPGNTAVGLDAFKRAIDDLQGKVTWVRFYIQEWEMMFAIESPTLVNFNTRYLDRYKEAVEYAKAKGFKVQLNAATPLREDTQKMSHTDYVELVHTEFAFLARYFPMVDVWQVINEGNISCFRTWNRLWDANWMIPDLRPEALQGRKFPEWSWGSRPMSVNYLKELGEVMAAASKAIRANSFAKITTSISGAPFVDPALTEKTLQRLFYYIDAIRPSIDIIGMDVYMPLPADSNYQKAYDQLPYFFQQLKSRYSDKHVMVAETGISSQGWERSPATQATILVKSAKAMADAGVSPVLIYEYRNSVWSTGGLINEEFAHSENGFGIVEANTDARKPAYHTIMDYLMYGRVPDTLNGGGPSTPVTPVPPTPPVSTGNKFCGATKDARLGSQAGNQVEAKVNSQEECFNHCKQYVRAEDQPHWLNGSPSWNMCWYDGAGFINSAGARAPASPPVADPTPPPATGNKFCGATKDARLGSQPGNQVETKVNTQAECFNHCKQHVRSADQPHWLDDSPSWNMCWYDGVGFINSAGTASTTPATLFCEAQKDARLGTVESNVVPTKVRNRAECVQHCRGHIRQQDQAGWQSGWGMCWLDGAGFIH